MARQPLGLCVAKVYIEAMRSASRSLARLLAAAVLAAPLAAGAQGFSADYDISRPAVSIASYYRGAGTGLSMEAGQSWFARVSVGRSLDNEVFSAGGGYRFADGQSLSLQVLRTQKERLGLAVRYDWQRYYLRLSYDPRWGDSSPPETVRFSAGMRF